MTCSFQFTG